jgi:hypothetical protein
MAVVERAIAPSVLAALAETPVVDPVVRLRCQGGPHEAHELGWNRSNPMSRHIQVTFDAHDPRALSTFWRDVLGYVHPGPPGVDLPSGADPLAAWDEFLARAGVPEEQRNSRSAIEDPDGQGPRLFFQQVPEDKVAKNRVHLDVRAAPGLQGEERMAALEAQCDRLVALGATRVRRDEPAPPMSFGFIVMADPEGNEFCLD